MVSPGRCWGWWNHHRHRSGGTAVGYSMKGGDFSWPPVGTFRGHQWRPQLATSGYFLMATDSIPTTFAYLLDWTPMMSSITRVFDADRNQFDDSPSVLFGANVSHECRTSGNESKWVIIDG